MSGTEDTLAAKHYRPHNSRYIDAMSTYIRAESSVEDRCKS
jgi:hypothetical protein